MPPCLSNVQRQTYLPAAGHYCVYAQSPSYTHTEGVELIETIKHEAIAFDRHGNKHFYHQRIFRRLSPDNGQTWAEQDDFHQETADQRGGLKRHVPMHVLDPVADRLISVFTTYEVDPEEPQFAPRSRIHCTRRLNDQYSTDGGRTWTTPKPIIDHRPGHDEIQWTPYTRYGDGGMAADLCAHAWLDDDTLVLGGTISPAPNSYPPGDPRRHTAVACLQGKRCPDTQAMQWQCGQPVSLSHEEAPHGSAEPAIVALDSQRVFTAMRCQGNVEMNIPSRRWTALSLDGGMTWQPPQLLRYDDGQPVHTPASQSQFITDQRTGRIYWLANILPGPVFAQTPRYPLTLAEFDPERLCILRDSVSVIQDLPPGAPSERRYTNWGLYQDRQSGELVITLCEMPQTVNFSEMTDPSHKVGDCLRYRLTLHH